MTNKQRYQRAFSALHASGDCLMEGKAMKHTRKINVSRLAAACAAAVMVTALACAAYAADVGGIQRRVQLWINGDQTDAVLDIQGTGYTVTYQDEDGAVREFGGGGVAIEDDGSERPLTEAEIMEHSVWVCYHGGETEITDRFDADGVCYVQVKTDGGVLYLTVKRGNGFASSPHSYIPPQHFNTTAPEG